MTRFRAHIMTGSHCTAHIHICLRNIQVTCHIKRKNSLISTIKLPATVFTMKKCLENIYSHRRSSKFEFASIKFFGWYLLLFWALSLPNIYSWRKSRRVLTNNQIFVERSKSGTNWNQSLHDYLRERIIASPTGCQTLKEEECWIENWLNKGKIIFNNFLLSESIPLEDIFCIIDKLCSQMSLL